MLTPNFWLQAGLCCGIIDLALKRSLLKHNHFVFILKYRIAVYLTYIIRATIIGQTYKILQPLQQYTTTITTIWMSNTIYK